MLHMIRLRHGYTEGRVFPHRTRTRVHRTRTGYGYIPYRKFHGIFTVSHENRGIPGTRGFLLYYLM
jgi:hypothetical protein